MAQETFTPQSVSEVTTLLQEHQSDIQQFAESEPAKSWASPASGANRDEQVQRLQDQVPSLTRSQAEQIASALPVYMAGYQAGQKSKGR
jgi:hypothetical protein